MSASCSHHWPRLTVAALALLAACQEPATTIRVTVTFAPGLALDQLELEATPAGGAPLQARVPDPPAALESGARVALLVPDEWNGIETKIAVTGMASGSRAAEGRVSAEPVRGQVVDVSVTLEAPCRDECPLADMGCVGQAVSLCQKNAAGCASWGTPVPCPSDKPFCSSGKCDVVCHDECTSGQKRCSGTAGYQVCEAGSAGCLAWATIVYCEAQQICQAGACQADPCAGTVCDKPPASSCLNVTTLRSYGAQGNCAGGQCSYAPSDTTCANGCEDGACKGNDPCKGMSCTTPPAPTCTDTATLRSYSPSGVCSGGACSYTPTDTTCANGCEAGLCKGDPCAGVTCTTPPSVCYQSTGVCSNATCSYAYADGTECSDGNACTTGDRCKQGACAGTPISCTSPPAPTCADSKTLRTYAATGTCSGGSCSYAATDATCSGGCSSGACQSTCGADGTGCGTDPYGLQLPRECWNGACSYQAIICNNKYTYFYASDGTSLATVSGPCQCDSTTKMTVWNTDPPTLHNCDVCSNYVCWIAL